VDPLGDDQAEDDDDRPAAMAFCTVGSKGVGVSDPAAPPSRRTMAVRAVAGLILSSRAGK
jgi:hypothetical protein